MIGKGLLKLIDMLDNLLKGGISDGSQRLDKIIQDLEIDGSPDYKVASQVGRTVKSAIDAEVNIDINFVNSSSVLKSGVIEALNDSTRIVDNAKEIDIANAVSSNNRYLLKKIVGKAIENIARSKKLIAKKIDDKYKDTIDEIISNFDEAENILKGKTIELNKHFVDNRSQKEKISGSAEKVYNSYLLLYKLNEIKVDGGKPLQDVISLAIAQGEIQAEFKIKGNLCKISIIKKDDSYELKILGEHTKPEVKDILKYTDEDIIGLWARSEVSMEKDRNNWTFAIGLCDQLRQQDLKVGGLGKKVPFALRFANFYKVIEILKNEGAPLEERLRIANNIATGSGKTGDIALLKFWAYLVNISCVTAVPSDILRTQSNNFDREFLPDEVAQEFAEPFSETNAKYATLTFAEAFNTQWNVLNNTYGKNKSKPALILIDEAPKLKENVVQMARAVEVARYNSTAFFSATPDAFLSEEFEIKQQILLSPREREALGIGKLPVFYTTKKGIYSASHRVRNLPGNLSRTAEKQYVKRYENTHLVLDHSEKRNQNLKRIIDAAENGQEKSQLFLDFIDQTLDSQAYKVGLIASEQKYHNRDDYIKNIVEEITESKKIKDIDVAAELERRKQERQESFISSITHLNTRLNKYEIEFLVKENLNTSVSGKLLSSIKLHNIIDTFNEYRKNRKAIDRQEIGQFIEEKYYITDILNTDLTGIILELENIYNGSTKLRRNFDRNYEGDKKLHDNIFSVSNKIEGFCEKDAIISYFNGEIRRFSARGVEDKDAMYESDKQNILNFAKAGFVPRIISKELAIGIDAPRLGQAAIIAVELSEILDPNFLLQLVGRVGRDVNKKGKCYIDSYVAENEYINLKYAKELSRISYNNYIYNKSLPLYPYSIPKEYRDFPIVPVSFTDTTVGGIAAYRNVDKKYMRYEAPMYLNLENIGKLSGKEFFDVMERGCKTYNNDEINIFSIYASLMSDGIFSAMRRLMRECCNINTTLSKKDVYEEIFQSIKDTLKVINTNFNYNQEKVLQVFYYALLQQGCPMPRPITHDDITTDRCNDQFLSQGIVSLVIETLEAAMKKEMAIKGKNTIPKYSNDMSLADWARYIVHAKLMNHEDLLKADPNSSAPIFMEQKERSQRRCAFVHNASESIGTPSTASKSFQQVSTKKKIMYGVMIASPFIAVGIYALVVGAAVFNPVVAAGIFVGAVVTAAILFGAVKIYEKKAENPDMEVGTAVKEAFSTLWSSHKVTV